MKTIITLLCLVALFSCSTYNKVLFIEDEFKLENSIKLLQHLEGFSDEQKSVFFNQDYYFPLKTVYTKSNSGIGAVQIELKLTTNARTEQLDSVIYIQINEDKFKLVSNDYDMLNYINNSTSTSTETTSSTDGNNKSNSEENESVTTSTTNTTTTTDQTLQAMKHTFEIPEDMWKKIAYCDEIMLRIYMENEGVDVKFRNSQFIQFRRFFKEVLKAEFTNSKDTSI